jgi:hypothetical protein
MAIIKEYKVSYVIPLDHATYQPGNSISMEEYGKLGIYQDRVEIVEREVPDELLDNELLEYPEAEVVEETEETLSEEVTSEVTEELIEEVKNENVELENARAKYFAIFGEKPHHAKSLKTILEEINQEKEKVI